MRRVLYPLFLGLAVAGLGTFLWLAPVAEWDVPYVQTPQPVVDKMLEMADVGPSDVVYDLGAGDGRIAIAAVQDYDAYRAVGIEIDPRRVRKARENMIAAGVSDRVDIVKEDFFKADFSDASVVTMYLLTGANLKLRPRLLTELSPGSRVVSHDFDMGQWPPDATAEMDGAEVFMWIVPARVAGVWQWRIDENVFRLSLEQRFQKVTGRLAAFGESLPITEATLDGENLAFTAGLPEDGANGRIRFDGLVLEGRMKGRLTLAGETHPITAHRTAEPSTETSFLRPAGPPSVQAAAVR